MKDKILHLPLTELKYDDYFTPEVSKNIWTKYMQNYEYFDCNKHKGFVSVHPFVMVQNKDKKFLINKIDDSCYSLGIMKRPCIPQSLGYTDPLFMSCFSIANSGINLVEVGHFPLKQIGICKDMLKEPEKIGIVFILSLLENPKKKYIKLKDYQWCDLDDLTNYYYKLDSWSKSYVDYLNR